MAGGIVAVAVHDDGGTAAPATTAAAASPAPAGQPVTATPSNAISALVQQAEPSIVAIHDSISQTDIFGRTESGQAAGTGFVLSTDGYIVTNDHVVDGATDITVHFSDGKDVAATGLDLSAHAGQLVTVVRSTNGVGRSASFQGRR